MFSSLGYYMFIPFLGVYLLGLYNYSSWQIGFVVGIGLLATRAGAIFLPRLVNSLGDKWIIFASYILVATLLLFTGLAQLSSYPLWIIVSAILGVSFSSATLAMKVWIANCVAEGERINAYSVLNIAVNIGAACGPAIAGLLTSRHVSALPLVTAINLALSSVLAIMLPRERLLKTNAIAVSKTTKLEMSRIPKEFLFLIACGAFTWIAYAQVFDVFPTYAKGHLSESLVGLLFTINAILIIVLQTPFTHYLNNVFERRNKIRAAICLLAISQFVLGMSFLGFMFIDTHIWFGPVLGMILFTCSEVIWSPLLDVLVAEVRGTLGSATAFAYTGLVWGVAESIGSWCGLVLINKQLTHGVSPILLGMIVAFLSSIFFAVQLTLERSRSIGRSVT